jgi:hypothetical protein
MTSTLGRLDCSRVNHRPPALVITSRAMNSRNPGSADIHDLSTALHDWRLDFDALTFEGTCVVIPIQAEGRVGSSAGKARRRLSILAWSSTKWRS